MSRIYVAGASREVGRCATMIAELRSHGHEITHDWTRSVLAHGGGAPALAPNEERDIFFDDIAIGVRRAHFVVALAPREGVITEGAWFELGVAYERKTPIILVGDRPWGVRQLVWRRVARDEDVFGLVGDAAVEGDARG